VSDWYNPQAWSSPSRIVTDIVEPSQSRILGPDGTPIAYKPQKQPIGFYPIGDKPKARPSA
jgi:hypothetical protein